MTLKLIVWNGLKQVSVNVIMHIWKTVNKISLPLRMKSADWDLTNVYFRAIMGDFWTKLNPKTNNNKWKDRNQPSHQERSQIYSEMGLKCDKLSKPYWENYQTQ